MTEEMDFALTLLRVAIGLTMVAHGYNHFFKGGRIAGTGRWFESLGMRPGRFHAVLASTLEIVTGLLMMAGLLTPFAAAGFVGLLFVAYWTVHRKNGFMVIREGWEYVFVLSVAAVTVAMLGPGGWSADDQLDLIDVLDGWVGLAISAGGGLLAATALLLVFYRPPAPEPGPATG
ncbi:MAG: hypothetical protein JJLCMIEE_03327 [Acidimicrobiales bacterium]|nr:MAG: DoxX family protein [Actinomycetota bacterium]MBV6510197.1 hypothetical protein [Acidimicrobiales bacterium]RIK03524.1 MAG: DoxX family protein [Acidobacteriota bacterium]